MAPNLHRLDDTLALLRPARRKRTTGGRAAAYAAGLQALGWEYVYTPDYRHKLPRRQYRIYRSPNGSTIALGTRDELLMLHPDGTFKPLPYKARRNILLAGQ